MPRGCTWAYRSRRAAFPLPLAVAERERVEPRVDAAKPHVHRRRDLRALHRDALRPRGNLPELRRRRRHHEALRKTEPPADPPSELHTLDHLGPARVKRPGNSAI